VVTERGPWPVEDEDLLEIRVSETGPGVRVVRVRGELNETTAFSFERLAQEALAAGRGLVVLDLSDVTTLGPEGVQALVRVAYRAGEADIGLCLAGADRDAIINPLDAAGVRDLFEIDVQ
jgi:anti-anti-sigma factor